MLVLRLQLCSETRIAAILGCDAVCFQRKALAHSLALNLTPTLDTSLDLTLNLPAAGAAHAGRAEAPVVGGRPEARRLGARHRRHFGRHRHPRRPAAGAERTWSVPVPFHRPDPNLRSRSTCAVHTSGGWTAQAYQGRMDT